MRATRVNLRLIPRAVLAGVLAVLACGGEGAEGGGPVPSGPDSAAATFPAMGSVVRSMTPVSGPPGTQVALEVTGLPLSADVEVGFGAPNASFEILARARTDSAGSVTTSVAVPAWAEPGRGYVFVLAPVDQPPRAASPIFQVTAAGDAPPAPPASGDEIVRVEGRLTDEGVECPAMRSLEDKLYTLIDLPEGFRPGEHVYVEGTLVQISMCMQGVTLAVVRIERR